MKEAEVVVQPPEHDAGSPPDVQPRSIKVLTSILLKRTYDMFLGNHGQRVPLDEASQRLKIGSKISDEYACLKGYNPRHVPSSTDGRPADVPLAAQPSAAPVESKSTAAKLIDSVAANRHDVTDAPTAEPSRSGQLILFSEGGPIPASDRITPVAKAALSSSVMVPTAAGGRKEYIPSAAIARRAASKWPRPEWHAPWRCYRVISGHLGWVRAVAFDPANEWFVTGSGDRTIKVWDTASGGLRLTLTGHIEQVTGLAVSDRSPYMFSCGLDKLVKCWDLEHNRVIRHYHGHLSGVYSLALHPTLEILATGGRDATCRVWDVRTKTQVFALGGHEDTVSAILTQGTDPQIITASHDKTVRLWDLRTGKTISTLTYHKKAVRALAAHPTEHAFASGGADNIKKFRLPEGEFLHNMLQQQRAIINALAINEDGVMASGGDNGSLWMWDWRSGNCFQEGETVVQPGSLDSEAGIYAMSFDRSGTRLVTCEADKSIKMWKEDENATPETHPISFKPPKDIKRF
jgi:pleiotropic regulator 1